MDGYVRVARSFHGSGGKEILRSIGLPRKTKVGRVRSKSWTTHGRRIIGRCESVGVRKRLEKTRTVHLRLKTVGLYSQVGDRSRGMRDVEVDRLAVGRKEIIHINIDTHVISFKRIFSGIDDATTRFSRVPNPGRHLARPPCEVRSPHHRSSPLFQSS